MEEIDGTSFFLSTHLPTASTPTAYGNSTITPGPSSNGALVSRGYKWEEGSRMLFRSPHVVCGGALDPQR